MLHILAKGRTLGLVLGLTVSAAAVAVAQDTTQSAGAPLDTSEAQNPPGYRGMERPTNVFPAESADSASRDTSPGAVEDRVTGTHDDSTWQDTAQGEQNPAGYRGMERPTGDSAAADTTAADSAAAGEAGDTGHAEHGDTAVERPAEAREPKQDTSAVEAPEGDARRSERPAAADTIEGSDTAQ
jgi:hypothetical protein